MRAGRTFVGEDGDEETKETGKTGETLLSSVKKVTSFGSLFSRSSLT